MCIRDRVEVVPVFDLTAYDFFAVGNATRVYSYSYFMLPFTSSNQVSYEILVDFQRIWHKIGVIGT